MKVLIPILLSVLSLFGPKSLAQTLKAWGQSNGKYSGTNIPKELISIKIKNLSAGMKHGLIVTDSGKVHAFGVENKKDQLLDNYGQTIVPWSLPKIKSVAAGCRHSLALSTDGRVFGWGADDKKYVSYDSHSHGQSLVPKDLTDVVEIAAGGDFSVALKSDGSVVVWGDQKKAPSRAKKDVIGIAAGMDHVLALKKDGSVLAWGSNKDNQCNVPDGLQDAVAVAAGYKHSVILKKDGSLVLFGNNEDGQLNMPAQMGKVVKIAAGGRHSLAVNEEGKLFACGLNKDGQCNIPTDVKLAQLIAAGGDFSVIYGDVTPPPALTFSKASYDGGVLFQKEGGSVKIDIEANCEWKIKSLPIWITANATQGNGNLTLELTCRPNGRMENRMEMIVVEYPKYNQERIVIHQYGKGGFLETWGEEPFRYHFYVLPFVTFSIGYGHGVGVTAEGRVHSWGFDEQKQATEPKEKLKDRDVVKVAAGYGHSVALRKNGTLIGWGAGLPKTGCKHDHGQIYFQSWENHDFIDVKAGFYHTLEMTSRGSVRIWGDNTYGQATVPKDAYGVVAIAAVDMHNLALKFDGTIMPWGMNKYGQTDVPPSSKLGKITAIAAGKMALRSTSK